MDVNEENEVLKKMLSQKTRIIQTLVKMLKKRKSSVIWNDSTTLPDIGEMVLVDVFGGVYVGKRVKKDKFLIYWQGKFRLYMDVKGITAWASLPEKVAR
jgi:hypothetical protein